MIIEQFVSLFVGMDTITVICLCLGLILAIAEIFQPGFIALGVMGAIMLITGIALRVSTESVEDAFAMVFMLVFLIVLVLVIAFFAMVSTVRRAWLVGAPYSDDDSTEDVDSSVDYSHLKGRLGVATTTLRPVGKVEIDDEIFEVIADGFFINRGQVVKVIKTNGSKIVVCRADV